MKFYISSAAAPHGPARHPKRRQNCWLLPRGACGRVLSVPNAARFELIILLYPVFLSFLTCDYLRATRDWSYWMSFIPRAAIHRSVQWRIPSPQTRRVVQTRDDGRHEANVDHSNDAQKCTSDSLDGSQMIKSHIRAALLVIMARKTWQWFEKMHWRCCGFVCCMCICKHMKRLCYGSDRVEGELRQHEGIISRNEVFIWLCYIIRNTPLLKSF